MLAEWNVARKAASMRRLLALFLIPALMLAPAVVLCLGTIGYALGLEAWFSVSDAGPGTDGVFIGLANFQYLAGLDQLWQAVTNTGIYTAASTLLKPTTPAFVAV